MPVVRAISSKPKDETNAIQVNVSYDKGYGMYAAAYPAEVRPGGYTMLRLSLLCGSDRILLEQRKTNSKVRLAHWEAEVANQVKLRTGPAWDLVLTACQKNGLTVEPIPAE